MVAVGVGLPVPPAEAVEGLAGGVAVLAGAGVTPGPTILGHTILGPTILGPTLGGTLSAPGEELV